jgi:hypothetical protein
MASRGDSRWAVTLVVVLVVALGAMIGVAGLRLAQLRTVPLAYGRPYPAVGAGTPKLEVSEDVWTDPSSQAVYDTLNQYFTAINTKDYALWSATVTSARATQEPESTWRNSIRTGTIRLARIDQVGPGRLIALVSYASQQDPKDAPAPYTNKDQQLCWRVALPMVGSPPRVDVKNPGDTLIGPCR